MTQIIDDFDGEYRFLSNFSSEGGIKPTVEHHYQAWKAIYPEEYWEVLAASTPGKAKKLGRKVLLKPDWEDIKLQVMLDFLMVKFDEPNVKAKLLATGDAKLIEGNTWGDTYWGQVNGKGENWLGLTLEMVRDICRKQA